METGSLQSALEKIKAFFAEYVTVSNLRIAVDKIKDFIEEYTKLSIVLLGVVGVLLIVFDHSGNSADSYLPSSHADIKKIDSEKGDSQNIPIAKNQPEKSVVDNPVQRETTSSELLAHPLTNENQKSAVGVLISFHENITLKKFRVAYDCLSDSLKSAMTYEGWVPGFDTTVSSRVSQIKVLDENPSVINLSYILTAVDKIDGKEQISRFRGNVTLIKENGVWNIDEIHNKEF